MGRFFGLERYGVPVAYVASVSAVCLDQFDHLLAVSFLRRDGLGQ